MLKHENGITTITCDKCGFEESADTDSYNDAFYESKWGLYPRAKKYVHRCYDCMSKKHQRSMDFVREKFPLKPLK